MITDSGDDDNDDDVELSEPLIDPNLLLYHIKTNTYKNLVQDIIYGVHIPDSLVGNVLGQIPMVRQLFDAIIERARQIMDIDDRLRIIINHPQLSTPLFFPLTKLADVKCEKIMDIISMYMQSNESLPFDNHLNINLGILHMPKGGTRSHITGLKSILNKKSVIQITNNDNMCLARSIIVAFLKLHTVSDEEWSTLHETLEPSQKLFPLYKRIWILKCIKKSDFQNLIKKRCKLQENCAELLCYFSGVSTEHMITLDNIKSFEETLHVGIIVFSYDHQLGIIYRDPSNCNDHLFILKVGEHFHSIVNLTGFFGSKKYCMACFKPYQKAFEHRCLYTCIACEIPNCTKETCIECTDCHILCKSEKCLINHKSIHGKRKKPICGKYYVCPLCKTFMLTKNRPREKHICGEFHCKICSKFTLRPHKCYVRGKKLKKPVQRFIFFDYESMVLPTGEHVPNLVVCRMSCNECNGEKTHCGNCSSKCNQCLDTDNTCPSCYLCEKIFSGTNAQDDFGKWLFSSQNSNTVCLAHNSKNYDSYFILEYLIKNCITPKIIFNGAKIMRLEVQRGLNIIFIDSLNFLPMKLSELPFTFGFSDLVIKGQFPHLLNVPENQNYNDSWPDKKFYSYELLKPDEKIKFDDWYNNQIHKTFNLQHELLLYCQNDVLILQKACLKFRQLYLDKFSIDPFSYTTIASLCMGVFKTCFITEKHEVVLQHNNDIVTVEGSQLGGHLKVKLNNSLIPSEELKNHGYTIIEDNFISTDIALIGDEYQNCDNYSNIAIKYLKYLEHRDNVVIQHAWSPSGEFCMPGSRIKFDGYIQSQSLCIDILGCWFHGCETCLKTKRLVGKNMACVNFQTRYYETCARSDRIKKAGYKHIQIWEHEIHYLLKTNPSMKTFFDNCNVVSRLHPRDALYGGRVNGFKLYHSVKSPEIIKYLDIVSLYPSRQKYCKFPLQHPEIITSNFKDIREYFGLAKVSILPPTDLLFPVLPFKADDGRLHFTLCQHCTQTLNNDECTCSDSQRMLTAVYVIEELKLALKHNYQIIQIHEVYHFEKTSQYDPLLKNDSLFNQYVDTFIKWKIEASGYPDHVTTETQKNEYINEIYDKEHIVLDKSNILNNTGLKYCSKMGANNLWGKLCEKNFMNQNAYFTSDQENQCIQCITDPNKQLINVKVLTQDVVLVTWRNKHEDIVEHVNGNVILACFVTCYGRIRLYEEMFKIGKNLLYVDTDSLLYSYNPENNDYSPTEGVSLGELKSELKPGEHIEQFITCAPKTYAYLTNFQNYCCKVKGFYLDGPTSEKINFTTMKKLLEKEIDSIETSCQRITKNKYTTKIHTIKQKKIYKFVYAKRRLMNNYETLPRGYRFS